MSDLMMAVQFTKTYHLIPSCLISLRAIIMLMCTGFFFLLALQPILGLYFAAL